MSQFPDPTAADYFEYLLGLYFPGADDILSRCIQRAYRDWCRTLHGLDKARNKALHARASVVVRSFLTSLAEAGGAGSDQAAFDDRHRAASTELCSTYSAAGFAEFRVGQAQKWLNMALKYVFVFGEDRLRGYARLFELAHIPLDKIILNRLHLHGHCVPRLATSWSRVSSYEEYMGIQRWVRSAFPDSAPLAVEFAHWQNSGGAAPPD